MRGIPAVVARIDLGYPVEAAMGAASGYRPARRCRRCCSTTTKPWRSRSACASLPVTPWTASTSHPCGHWPNSNECCPPGYGTATRRLTEPHRLVCSGRRWYLLAFDNDRDDWRIFRVDRIQDPLLTAVRFTPRELPATDAASYVTGKLYSLAPTYQVVATLLLAAYLSAQDHDQRQRSLRDFPLTERDYPVGP